MEREHVLCWLWLSQVLNMSCEKILSLYEALGSIEEIYRETDYHDIEGLSAGDMKRLRNKALGEAEQIYERTLRIGAGILTYDDPAYPPLLSMISDPPFVLWALGNLPEWERMIPIGIVGTRSNTEYGTLVTQELAGELAWAGITIVSGMARGLDSVAAEAALNAKGSTIAVLGCGIDILYPPENGPLMERIVKNGLVLTEYPPGTPPIGANFPRRNRIISGLSKGVLVTQAPLKSGALITAHLAADESRDVFAVPGSIYSMQSEGTNLLIKQGAKPVTKSRDILEEYPLELSLMYPKIGPVPSRKRPEKDFDTVPEDAGLKEKEPEPMEKKRPEPMPDGAEGKILTLLMEEDLHIDDLIRLGELALNELNAALVILEVKGMIQKLPGNIYHYGG